MMPGTVTRLVSSADSNVIGTNFTPSCSPTSPASIAGGPPCVPDMIWPSACRWASSARSSTYSATRQPPSPITWGESTIITTPRSSSGTSSYRPAVMCMASGSTHLSLSAGPCRLDVMHGQSTSQLQFSRYSPVSCHVMGPTSHPARCPVLTVGRDVSSLNGV